MLYMTHQWNCNEFRNTLCKYIDLNYSGMHRKLISKQHLASQNKYLGQLFKDNGQNY